MEDTRIHDFIMQGTKYMPAMAFIAIGACYVQA